MKWITHQTVAACSALAAGMSGPAALAAWAGAVLPDALDHRMAALARNRQRAFNQIHRGPTHWFGWWLALWLFGLMPLLPPEWRPLVAGFGFGAFSHVVLDMCTYSGVPLTPFSRKRKVSLKLCATGSVGEYAFLAVCLVIFWFLAKDDLGRVSRELHRFFS